MRQRRSRSRGRQLSWRWSEVARFTAWPISASCDELRQAHCCLHELAVVWAKDLKELKMAEESVGHVMLVVNVQGDLVKCVD